MVFSPAPERKYGPQHEQHPRPIRRLHAVSRPPKWTPVTTPAVTRHVPNDSHEPRDRLYTVSRPLGRDLITSPGHVTTFTPYHNP